MDQYPDDQQYEEYDYSQANQTPVYQRKRVSFWAKIGGGSLTIAVLVHVILLIVGLFVVFKYYTEPDKKVDFMPPGGGGGGGGERGMEYDVKKKKSAMVNPSSVKRVFAEGSSSNFAIPDPGESFGELSSLSSLSGGGSSGGLGGAGSGSGFGNGSGGGKGDGKGFGFGGAGSGKMFGLIPDEMRKRCSKEDRLQRLRENGGTPECEDAVAKGLRWLKANQNSDGSWGNRKPAMTGLALLAYFGHCETPASEEFGDSCLKGIVYLVNVAAANDGRMASNYTSNSWCYEHAIATYALGEAATFCKQLKIEVPSLMQMTQKAGQFILDNQHDNGGWAYAYGLDSGAHTDVSIVGWHVQALKACDHAGLEFRGMTSSINKALKYIDRCQADSGGIGYQGPSSHTDYFTLTGAGMLANQMWGKGNRSEVRKAAKYIVENTKFDYNTKFADLYGHYYESQAMMQSGGDNWKFYNNLFRDQLLKNQGEDGCWKSPGGGQALRAVAPAFTGDSTDAKVYRTTLCTLMLEVYYRFLNTSGGGGLRTRPTI